MNQGVAMIPMNLSDDSLFEEVAKRFASQLSKRTWTAFLIWVFRFCFSSRKVSKH